MIKDYIQLGPFAFIEIPSKDKANKYIMELGICSHKWNEDNIEYGFSRYGIQNQFVINFYIAVGLHYHIYNVFIDAIEADCYGVIRTDGAFWEENILGKGYDNESLIKPKTEYIVVKILLAFPLKHITEIIKYHDKEREKPCRYGVKTTFGPSGPINTYMDKEIGRAMTDKQISDFLTNKYNFHLFEYCNCIKYFEHLTPDKNE